MEEYEIGGPRDIFKGPLFCGTNGFHNRLWSAFVSMITSSLCFTNNITLKFLIKSNKNYVLRRKEMHVLCYICFKKMPLVFIQNNYLNNTFIFKNTKNITNNSFLMEE